MTASSPSAAVAGEIFQAGTGVETTINALASTLEAALGRPIDVRREPDRSGDVRRNVSRVDKAARSRLPRRPAGRGLGGRPLVQAALADPEPRASSRTRRPVGMKAADDPSAGVTTAGTTTASSTLFRDAVTTVVTRFGLAFLIFGTDIVLARLLGPFGEGTLSLRRQLALDLLHDVLGIGARSGLRERHDSRAGRLANSLIWTAVVGGFGVLVSGWAYGLGHPGPPDGPLVPILPNPLGEAVHLFCGRDPRRASSPSA
jgi:hypothetical protein